MPAAAAAASLMMMMVPRAASGCPGGSRSSPSPARGHRRPIPCARRAQLLGTACVTPGKTLKPSLARRHSSHVVTAVLPAAGFLATPSALPVLAAACGLPPLLGYWKREYTVSYGYAGACAC